MQHKKLSVEGGEATKDFRKGQKQGDLQIWDPVDKVRGGPRGLGVAVLFSGFSEDPGHLFLRSSFSNGINTTA